MKNKVIAILFLTILLATPVLASTREGFFVRNNILFYNPNNLCSSNKISLQSNQKLTSENSGLSKNLMIINNPTKFANAINQWIKQKRPDSPLNNMGNLAVAGGQRAGINPILPIIIALKESELGTVGQISQRGHNAYGRTATISQPHFGTNRLWYKWNSFEESLLSDKNDDMYQYLANVYKNEKTIEEVMMKYAPPSENNTQFYIQQIKQWANEIYDLAGNSIDSNFIGSNVDYDLNYCLSNTASKLDNLTMFYQTDRPWATHLFHPDCGNIGRCGCGPTSLAIVIASLTNDKNVNPISISDQMIGMKQANGSSWSAFTKIPSKYNLKSQAIGTDLSKAKEAIDQGYLVIMSQDRGYFTTEGHIMIIRGFNDNGNILVADPNSKKYSNNQIGFDQKTVQASLRGMWVISR